MAKSTTPQPPKNAACHETRTSNDLAASLNVPLSKFQDALKLRLPCESKQILGRYDKQPIPEKHQLQTSEGKCQPNKAVHTHRITCPIDLSSQFNTQSQSVSTSCSTFYLQLNTTGSLTRRLVLSFISLSTSPLWPRTMGMQQAVHMIVSNQLCLIGMAHTKVCPLSLSSCMLDQVGQPYS